MASNGNRYNEEQIIRILKDVETGTSVAEVCRKIEGETLLDCSAVQLFVQCARRAN